MTTYQPFSTPQPANLAGYPPLSNPEYANSTSTLRVAEDPRLLSRTPSPTPSEARELKTGAIDWKTLSSQKFWFRREWLWYYVGFGAILIIVALVSIFHTQIVDWLTPATRWLHGLKFGWLVPIAIFFVISFPPLFGHEIVAILCGLVWGLWAGFAIVSAGTFLGEVGNFYAFRYCCRSRGEKLEKSKISYACLARVVRDGGVKIALIARLSAIPGHFTTAVFSTCGMSIFVFSIAAIVSMPKQFIAVYLGVILEQSQAGVQDKKSKIISDVVLVITFIITAIAMWYILREMDKVKPQVIYERRKARQAKLARASLPYPADGTDVFNPNLSDPDIPLTRTVDMETSYQRWDSSGRAVGFAADPTLLHTPKPQVGRPPFIQPYTRDVETGGIPPSNRYDREESTDAVEWDTGSTPNYPNVESTPTQRTFGNDHPERSLRSPFDEAYDVDVYDNKPHAQGPAHGPTSATFLAPMSSSPVHDEDLASNPYLSKHPQTDIR